MRIFDKKQRLNHTRDTIEYFLANEYQYYANNNIREFSFESVTYKAMYRRLNVQLLVTKKCPFNCPFCIEKVNPVGNEDRNEEMQLVNLKQLLETLISAGCEPTVSITGGEPTLFSTHVGKVKAMLDEMGVMCNINTSGIINSKTEELIPKFSRVNLSVHSCDAAENASIFGANRDDYWNSEIYKNATIQSVLLNADYSELEQFINSFNNNRFSIRFPAQTDVDNSIEWKELFLQLENNPDWTFVQQKIGDYYWFEEWKYKDKLIRFSFASIKQLEYYKSKFKDSEKFLTRAAIVLPNGDVRFDWISD